MSDEITRDEVERRAQAAGLAIRPERVEMVRKLLAEALAPLRKIDTRAVRTLEPAATFHASGGVDDGRR
jgi:hypothetical protein